MWRQQCGYLIIFILLAIHHIESGYVREKEEQRLNEYISHFETLDYDSSELHASHSRAKRSVTKDHHVNLKFKAHGKHFHIRLKRDLETFSDNLIVDSSEGPVVVDTAHIYHGKVLGDTKSHVFGSIHNGVFEGKIITSSDSYYVENARHYFPNQSHVDKGFHSVIYKESHVDDPYHHQRKGHAPGCGIDDEVIDWMERIQNSATDDTNNNNSPTAPPPKQFPSHLKAPSFKVGHQHEQQPPSISSTSTSSSSPSVSPSLSAKHVNNISQSQPNTLLDDDFKYPYEKYTKEANVRSDDDDADGNNNGDGGDSISFNDPSDWHKWSHERVRRAATRKDDNRNTCSLFIQTDPLIWRHIREGVVDQYRGKKSELNEKTREEILSLIAHHVTAVNYIYRNTKFDGRKEHRNIKFEVQRIKIDDDSACSENYNGESNPFCMENIDVSNFLNLHSLGNHEDFCLAYVFTYRDFTGGTLGLAWVASASGASGGICEKYKTYTETVGGLYQSTKRSLNTGIITFVNYNSRVPPKVSQLTLAHEIGHNFGSPHDYPLDCRPGGVSGNYIMFASATSGDRPNNSKFSHCSVRNISNVLDAIEENKKRNCFQVSEGAFCGNKIVESGEQCDCGYDDQECNDSCCYPRVISEHELSLNATAKGCTRKARTQCSPSQGPCCHHETCSFVPARNRVKCKEETECSWSSYCNGTTPECPEPKPRDDKTKCNNGTQLCINGECAGSICLLWNMTECFLTSQIIPHIDKRKLCELACQKGNDTCRSTSEFAHLYDLPDGGISLRPGSPCDNFQGYCDVFLKCRAVDAEGPLVRLKNLLLNKQTLQTVAQWVTENWYAVICMGIVFVIIMGAFIKCCAVHTPSSNPKKPPARRISETMRHPMQTLRRMRHPNRGPDGRSVPSGRPSNQHRSRSGGAVPPGPVGRSGDPRRPRDGRSGRPEGRSGGGAGRPPPAAQGYGDVGGVRTSQLYPKASAPPAPHYSRVHNEPYADAYPNQRPPYDPQMRHHNNKV